jgi:predicted phage baseplate assembly protein
MVKSAAGLLKTPLYYLRVRLSAGQFDAPPTAQRVSLNAVDAEQSIPKSETWPIASGAVIAGTPPAPGETAAIQATFNNDGQVTQLTFGPVAGAAPFQILDYHAAAALTLRAVRVGKGLGSPFQTVFLPGAPVDQPTLVLHTNEAGAWVPWTRQGDLAASKSGDSHFLLDPATGAVTFGDGARGRVPVAGAWIVAAYRTTRGSGGGLSQGKVNQLPPDPVLHAGLASVVNVADAAGGQDAESLSHTIGRAIRIREAPLRAVTLSDYETLSAQTPGTSIARVAATAGVYPGFDCLPAPGVVTVLVVPSLPQPRPSPSSGLLSAVAAYLEPRRIVGTRIAIAAPDYLEVTVQARVRAFSTAGKAQVRQAIVDALNRFLDPLRGGPDYGGWPFGRDVYRTEIMQVIDQTPGVDYVETMALLADGCGPMCGNLCLKPSWLVTPGAHRIEVV